jgi:hypothetical protein
MRLDLRLCSVVVLADQARDDAFSANAAEIDRFGSVYRFNIRRIVADLRFDVVGQCGEDRGLCLCASST